MGHIDVYEWLLKQRDDGNEGYFSCNEIKKHITFGNVVRDLKKLWKYNQVEITSDFLGIKRSYRAKR